MIRSCPKDILDFMCDALAQQGYVIIPDFLELAEASLLYHYAQSLPQSQWHLAGIGRDQQHAVNTHVRSDQIHWLSNQQPLEALWLDHMNQLRTELNRSLFLGLFDYECHLARYKPGSRYQKHLDAFKGRGNRVLSTVFYLNPHWSSADGGELIIYDNNGHVLERVLPTQSTLVVFLSDVFVHEVKIAHRTRYSITGWFRHNASLSGRIDPPA